MVSPGSAMRGDCASKTRMTAGERIEELFNTLNDNG
jgi:hypothetical protein